MELFDGNSRSRSCYLYVYVQGDAWIMDSTAGDDFLAIFDQHILYKHVSDFERLWSYGRWKLRIENKDYWNKWNKIIKKHIYIYIYSIQPVGRFSRNQSPVRRPGMALARCILCKFLGVGCHFFPQLLDVPTFSVGCLHVQRRERPLAAEGGILRGREMFGQIWPRIRFPRNSMDLQICDMGPTALLPLRRKACWGFFRP